jgi:hypothetical protein
MSYYLIDFTKKEQDFNFDNLIIGKKINTDQKYSKYYIYYEENNTAFVPCPCILRRSIASTVI